MKLKITVHGVAYEVDVEVLDAKDEFAGGSPLPQRRRSEALPGGAAAAAPANPAPDVAPRAASTTPATPGPTGSANAVVSPIAGTVVEIRCKAGDAVRPGQTLLVIEAMKMETAISAPAAGTVKAVPVAAGDSVRENEVLVEFA